MIEIVNYMNNPNCSWQKIGKKNALATIGFHKIAQRHLMNLSDICLRKAFIETPELTSYETFCGTWDSVDLSTSAFPRLLEPNKAYRIRGKFERHGMLEKPIRFTPPFSKEARKAVSRIKRKRKVYSIFSESDEKSDLESMKNTTKKVLQKKRKRK